MTESSADTVEVNEYSLVGKKNSLVSKLSQLKLPELRLLSFCLAHYDSRNSDDNRMIRATVNDLLDIFPTMGASTAYAVIKDAVISINSKPIEVEIEGRSRLRWWFAGLDYIDRTGEFEFMLNPLIEPFLLGLREAFTRFRLKNVATMQSATTWKFYELLRSQLKKREWSVSLDDLKIALGIVGKYAVFVNFRRQVLDPAIKEINEKTDLYIPPQPSNKKLPYTYIKRGRAITGLRFIIRPASDNQEDIIEVDSHNMTLEEQMNSVGIHPKTRAKMIALAQDNYLLEKITKRLPKIIKLAHKKEKENLHDKDFLVKYVTGSINEFLKQQSLFPSEKQETQPPEPDHKKSLDCWMKKGKNCDIRRRKKAKQKRCQQCFVDLPLNDFPEKN